MFAALHTGLWCWAIRDVMTIKTPSIISSPKKQGNNEMFVSYEGLAKKYGEREAMRTLEVIEEQLKLKLLERAPEFRLRKAIETLEALDASPD